MHDSERNGHIVNSDTRVSGVRVFEHDYETKARKHISLSEVSLTEVGNKTFWIDVQDGNLDGVKEVGFPEDILLSLEKDMETDMISFPGDIFRFDIGYVQYEDWLKTNEFKIKKIRCLLGVRFLITVHEGDSSIIKALDNGYVTDFRSASKAAVFLIYEMLHHVINSYLRIHRILQVRLKSIDEKITTEDETMIESAAKLHTEFLTLRETSHLSRNVLNHLASRASLFISANTRPYLDNMSMTLERLDDDLTTDRQIISDSLNFHVSVVSFKMNSSIKAMTKVNVIFVPLTLLAAIYGMNFVSMPEYAWKYGYIFFWILFFVTAFLSVVWLRKQS